MHQGQFLTMACPWCSRINRVTAPFCALSQDKTDRKNDWSKYFKVLFWLLKWGYKKNLGHSHFIPFLKLSARRCVHVPLYANFTFVSFSWFLLLRHLSHPFYAIFHSQLPLKKRLRTQELKPLTPPQRFKHCEQP